MNSNERMISVIKNILIALMVKNIVAVFLKTQRLGSMVSIYLKLSKYAY